MTDGWQGGVFSVSIDMSANDAAGIPIVSSAFSNQMDVVKAGINDTLNKAGQNQPTANLPMGGFRHTQAGAPTEADQYMRVREIIHSFPIFMTDSEAASSLSLSVASSLYPVSLTAGMWVRLKVDANKPSASASEISFHVNGLSANVVSHGTNRLWPGAFTSGQIHELIYDGSAWHLQNPGAVWVTRHFNRIKGWAQSGAVVTAAGLPAISVDSPLFGISVDMRRLGDKAEVRVATSLGKPPAGNAGGIYSFEGDVEAQALYLSTIPDWMRPESRRFCDEAVAVGSAGAGPSVVLGVFVSTDGKIIASKNLLATQNTAQALGEVGALMPFTIIYRLKG